MDQRVEEAYLREILIQVSYVRRTAIRAKEILRQDVDLIDFFREMAALLRHAAAISRILWPPRPGDKLRAEARGLHLRQVLQLDDEHFLSDRTFRNHFEHFEERLDDWAETSISKKPIDLYFGPREQIIRWLPANDFLRGFDPASRTLFFRSESFDVESLVGAAEDIGRRATARSQQIERNRLNIPEGPEV